MALLCCCRSAEYNGVAVFRLMLLHVLAVFIIVAESFVSFRWCCTDCQVTADTVLVIAAVPEAGKLTIMLFCVRYSCCCCCSYSGFSGYCCCCCCYAFSRRCCGCAFFLSLLLLLSLLALAVAVATLTAAVLLLSLLLLCTFLLLLL